MNRLMIAAAATALCATATTFTAPAEAGMRFGGGIRFHHFAFRPHFYNPPVHRYSAPDDDEVRARRRITRSKPEKTESKEAKVPLVKFADGTGRQYDPASKVWFDGASQCYSGKQAFTFKNGSWFYGTSRWSLSNGNWQSTSDAQPELVSCDSVAKFAAKANATVLKTAAQGEKAESNTKSTSEQPIKTPVAPAPKIKTAEGDPAADKPGAAPTVECKKYFPSVGQMLAVPCE